MVSLQTPHAEHLRVNEELTIYIHIKKLGMGFCNKTWRNKGKILYKKEEEMRHLILIAPNNNYVFLRH